MTSTSFDTIAFNCDVMIHIYKFLNIGDQLRLAQVDANLRNIFLQFILPISSNKLKVIKFDENYIVSNDTDTVRILIQNSRDFEDFLQIFGNNVCDFSVRNSRDNQKFGDLFTDTPLRIEFFKNIVKLKFYMHRFTINDMAQLTNNLPNLEELQLEISEFENEQPNDCSITAVIFNELLRLVKLKKLELHIEPDCHIRFKDFYKIVTKLPLEKININTCPMLLATEDIELELQQSPLPLMQLLVTIKGNNRIFYSMLNSFRNLKILTIEGHFNEIGSGLKSLTQLHQLTIKSADFDEQENVTTILPPNITTLYLKNCTNLCLDHLQQLLHENSNPKLIEFAAFWTKVRVKEFKELHISSRIKILDIRSFNLDQFHSPFAENSELEKLTLHKAEDLRFINTSSSYVRLNSISFCHNLHTLDMYEQNLAFDTLLILRNLRKLSLSIILPEQEEYIIRILQELPSLRELVVRPYETFACLSLRAVVTSVTSLKIMYLKLDDEVLDFWLDMFSLNPQLELEISIEKDFDEPIALQYLIEHEKFPRKLRKIQICGFTVDCNDLRNNESAFQTINNFIDSYQLYTDEEEKEYHKRLYDEKCEIIMSRKDVNVKQKYQFFI
ncbi:uncharacterized protein [Musca autumnalis]|uniref:uncharacterized protein n=1 Tax=Musca autumnalis TaxID=221902 RepID=UPI003CFB4393